MLLVDAHGHACIPWISASADSPCTTVIEQRLRFLSRYLRSRTHQKATQCTAMAESRPPRFSLDNVPSQHPKVRLEVSGADLEAPEGCTPYVLVQLSPALFVDPYELPPYRSLSEERDPSTSVFVSVTQVHIFGKTELESAVGWTDPKGARRKIAARRAPRSGADLPHSHALSSEASQVLFQLDLKDPANPQPYSFKDTMDALLHLKMSPKPTRKQQSASELARVHTLHLPLHTRYIPPVQENAGVSASAPLPDWKLLIKQVMDLRKGNYENVELPEPQYIYSCIGEPSYEETFKMDRGWKYIQPSDLLQNAWAQYKLSPPLPASTNPNNHRLLARTQLGTGILSLPPADGWTLPIPRGDASLTTLTQLITASVIGLTALYAFLSIRSSVSQVERSEALLRKRAESKSQ
ncbi:hypothetical protein K437DRAFT_271892 [Tilletiaria anomala UBC 951]|uniref:Protein PBN1 n=1 Tax=Tilletiaria anomala (strain ATCC 24038 / CBS 436.72 / UBC 951) TaxID=1037660 RepID=A0A066WQ20_TILAU|nr:uncharacterized protein K437DRAFT_271892 [Tilletiaria anomala UBC 951]KDN53104.1 hypothetical protein K437DRAFT_271892 [Tilletiaria anomala UBC 951]